MFQKLEYSIIITLLKGQSIKGTPKTKLHIDIQNKFIERFRGSIYREEVFRHQKGIIKGAEATCVDVVTEMKNVSD